MQNFPSFASNPSPKLRAILDPPDVLSGTPGETVSLGVVVQNAGDRGSIINVFINDDADAMVLDWCQVPRQRLALDPQQKEELIFDFTLPATAAAATYDYLLVLDAPEGYPEEPPMQYPLQLRVLFKEQTVLRANDPTFFINPATNPQKPAPLQPGQILQFQVRVDNRSNNVDNYRLSCPDLEEDWFDIRCPKPNLGDFGLVTDARSLDLNPHTQGIIQLEIHPPIGALAGIYIPSIYLHSVNLPDLRRLDCVYFEILRVETLEVDLETIIGRISHTAGQYRLNLKNTGNVIRQVRFSASSRDEDEICTYSFDPPTVRLLPNQTAQVLLLVTPNQPKQRPFWGMGQTINFQVALHDADGYHVPDRPVQGVLTWKARPWWQLFLLVLLVLGLVAGGFFLVRWLLQPKLTTVEEFQPVNEAYEEGETVQLEWRVVHPKPVKTMILTATPAIQPNKITIDPNNPSQCLPEPEPPEQIRCKESVGGLSAQAYEFKLSTTLQNGQSLSHQVKLTIAPKPPPIIGSFEPTKTRYSRSEPVQLNWTISNSDQLDRLTLIATHAKEQSQVNIPLLRSKTGQGIKDAAELQPEANIPDLTDLCQLSQTGMLTCSGVSIPPLDRAGDYTFQLQATVLQPQGATAPRPPVNSPPTGTVTIQPRSLVLRAFVNDVPDSAAGIAISLEHNDDRPLRLSWDVSGGEGTVQVQVQNNTQPKTGTLDISPPLPGQSLPVTFVAVDESGQPSQQITFTVQRRPTPVPTPTPTPVPSPVPSAVSSPTASP